MGSAFKVELKLLNSRISAWIFFTNILFCPILPMHFIWLKFRIEIFEILSIQPNYLLLLKIFCMLQWFYWLNFQQIRFNKSGPIKAYFTSKIAVQWILAFLFLLLPFKFFMPSTKATRVFSLKTQKRFPQQSNLIVITTV